jgi:hypothetical protein
MSSLKIFNRKNSDKISWLVSCLFKHLILHVGVTHREENENTSCCARMQAKSGRFYLGTREDPAPLSLLTR